MVARIRGAATAGILAPRQRSRDVDDGDGAAFQRGRVRLCANVQFVQRFESEGAIGTCLDWIVSRREVPWIDGL